MGTAANFNVEQGRLVLVELGKSWGYVGSTAMDGRNFVPLTIPNVAETTITVTLPGFHRVVDYLTP